MKYILFVFICLFIGTGFSFANQAPLVDSAEYSPSNTINPGQAVTITVTAHDPDCSGSCSSGCGLYLRNDLTQWSVTDTGGNTQAITSGVDKGVSGSPYTTSVVWTAPPQTGAYTFHVYLADSGSFMCGGRQSLTYDIPLSVAVGNPPVITSLVAEPDTVFTNRSSTVTAQAYDPDGDPITYNWSADGGIIKPTSLSNRIEWIAPSTGGVWTIKVEVQDSNGIKVSRSIPITAVVAKFKSSINAGLKGPGRIAVDENGNIYVTDQIEKKLFSFTPQGNMRLIIDFSVTPLAVDVDETGRIFVGLDEVNAVYVFDRYGKFLRFLGKGTGEFLMPVDISHDKNLQKLYVADLKDSKIKVYNYSCTRISEISLNRQPAGIAVDPQNGNIFVTLLTGSDTDNYIYEFTPGGTFKNSFSPYSAAPSPGKNVRVQGIAVNSNSESFVADAYLGWVQVLSHDGSHLAYVGQYGGSSGLMRMPADVAIDKYNRLVVADTKNSRIDIYEFVTASQPVCYGDRDCDGMPDSWELTYGLNPDDPSDFAFDPDKDGLPNLEEFIAGTDPTNPDTDGDGILDGDELKGGTNPADEQNMPVANAGSDQLLNPTVVTLNGTGSYDPNGLPLTYRWTQVSGPSVVLENSEGPEPYFVGRESAEYEFSLIVSNGKISSKPDSVKIRINNIAPSSKVITPVAGYIGEKIYLDGSLSSDPNGDTIHYFYEQVSGVPVTLYDSNSAKPYFEPTSPGIYTFSLYVSDGDNTSEKSLVQAIVISKGNLPPLSVIKPVPDRVMVGTVIELDGSMSIDPESNGLAYTWTQEKGPVINQPLSNSKKIKITLSDPGLYRFSLVVSDGVNVSLPTQIEFVVDSQGKHVPHAFAGYDMLKILGDKICLNGSGSFDPDSGVLSYNWEQRGGLKVDLGDSNSQISCFTPAWEGVYHFGLRVFDGEFESSESIINIIVKKKDENLPLIEKSALQWGMVDESVEIKLNTSGLDGFIIEQTSGVPSPLSYTDSGFQFVPYLPGVYTFKAYGIKEGIVRFERDIVVIVSDTGISPPVPVVQNFLFAKSRNSVLINASESFSPDGRTVEFLWRRGNGEFVNIVNPYSSILELSDYTSGKTYQIELNTNNAILTGLSVPVKIAIADKDIVMQEIMREKGGSIANKIADIFIPQGALFEDASIGVGSIKKENLPPPPQGKEYSEDGLYIAPESTMLLTESSLRIYAAQKLNPGDKLMYYNGNEWIDLQNVEVKENVVLAKINSFGVYAILTEENKSKGNSDPRCFIATAIYGNDSMQVKILREFRDSVLLKFSGGRNFVNWYYRVSPFIADFISSHSVLKYSGAAILLPVVVLAYLFMKWYIILVCVFILINLKYKFKFLR